MDASAAERERERVLEVCRDRGDFVQAEDGSYNYWPEASAQRGYIAAHQLRWIADHLDAMNQQWREQLDKACSNLQEVSK